MEVYLQNVSLNEVGHATWPQDIHALLWRLLTEDLQERAHEEVSSASQEVEREEASIRVRIMKAIRCCRNLLTITALVRLYVSVLIPESPYTVIKGVRQLPTEQRSIM